MAPITERGRETEDRRLRTEISQIDAKILPDLADA